MIGDELEEMARRVMADEVWRYVAGGVGDEVTLRDNRAAWRRRVLRPRLMVDVSEISTATTVLGTAIPTPIVVAPTAMHAMSHPDGELATARGAAAAGAIYVLSQAATTSLEDVAAAAPGGHRWMQLYVQSDRGRTRAVCERAAAAGYEALVVTVDSPVLMRRPGVANSAFVRPLPNLAPGDPSPDLFELVNGYDPALTERDIEAISSWAHGLPVVVKGIVRGDDARRVVDSGAAAVVVSNHGGRQLDGCIATADALPEVVEAVAGQVDVLVDGGVRRGTDVLVALALGARAVLVGRPLVFALATGGADAVTATLTELGDELWAAMGLAGVCDATRVPRDLIAGCR
jgi:4-hydroxymandelate oxidase